MKNSNLKQQKMPDFMDVFLILSIFGAGLVHEFLACAAGIALCIKLGLQLHADKKMHIYINPGSISVVLICLGYAFSILTALDKGLAVLGFFKFLPLLLFLLVFMQQPKNTDACLRFIPHAAVFMTLVSTVCMQIPVLKEWFSVSGRLAGFFQYSNTFALFLLIALVIVATKEAFGKTDIACVAVLLFGILYSGSRTVFLLLLAVLLCILIFGKNKAAKCTLLAISLVGITVAVIYAAVTDNFSSVARFLSVSLQESTFVGRLLYYRDALPVILRHPFGMGYLGYYFYQQCVQTGVYTVRYLHNDFLQLMLDIGWIPAIAFLAAAVHAFFKKGTSLRHRILLAVIAAHAFFDFDLQFLAVFMLTVLLLDCKSGKEKSVSVKTMTSAGGTVLLCGLFAYFGIAQGLSYFKQYELSDKIYPNNTLNHIAMIQNADDLSDITHLADRVLQQNAIVPIAYDVKAKQAYAEGDFATVITYKRKAIAAAPFLHESYTDYCYMLINGIQLYEQYGDEQSAQVCRTELFAVAEQVRTLPQRLSTLGQKISDQPDTQLPADIQNYLDALTG